MVCRQGHTRRLPIRRAVCLFVELLSFVEVPPSVALVSGIWFGRAAVKLHSLTEVEY